MQPKVVPGCQTPVKDGTVIVTGEYDKRDTSLPALPYDPNYVKGASPASARRRPRPTRSKGCSQPPARLPGLRQGRRVQAAGLQLQVRPVREPDGRREEHAAEQAATSSSKITLFTDRCIMCTRCVRFTREISGTAELQVDRPRAPRGDRRLPRPAAGEQARRQRRRSVPGRGARAARTSSTSSASGT